MTTDYEDFSITSLPLASDKDFVALVTSFSVDPDSPDLSFLQRDGATAVIDLATEFERYGVASNPDLIARVIGRLRRDRCVKLLSHKHRAVADGLPEVVAS